MTSVLAGPHQVRRRRSARQTFSGRAVHARLELLESRLLLDAAPIVSAAVQVGTTQSLSEISGIAVSRSLPGNLWVHQDSGDIARFYGLTTAGVFHSTITLSGAPAFDWEDMTIGAKPGGGNYLYFGDIGDNSANRFAGVDIIRVTEPTTTGNATLTSADYTVKRVLYPGLIISFPKNAESLFADPLTGDLYIISKQAIGGIYRLPASQFDAPGSSTLESLVNINAPLSNPTAADISPDGKYIIVRNSSSGGTTAYLFARGTGQSVANALQGTPTIITLHSEPQGETIGWTPDGTGFYTISEGTTRPIWFYTFDTLPTNVSAGSSYTITEGATLNLTASATGLGPLVYSWDVNNDGVFGDATGINPTLTWPQLQALDINDGPISQNLRVQVDNGAHPPVVSSATPLTINNSLPTAGIAGPAAVARDQAQDFTLLASDVSGVDQAAGFTYTIDWNGDGADVQIVSGLSGLVVAHTFNTVGTRTIKVTATDKDGGLSSVATLATTVSAVQLVNHDGVTDLAWIGTAGADDVQFEQLDATTIRVTTTLENGLANTFVETHSGITGIVTALGLAGDDALDASLLTSTATTLDGGTGNNALYGGDGNDTLIGGGNFGATVNGPEGQQGSNIVVGGAGDDTLYGNSVNGAEGKGGNNILLGGAGNDTLYGNWTAGGEGGGRNILVGGADSDTLYDYQVADGAEGRGSILIGDESSLGVTELGAILSEWTSARPYSTRVENVLGLGAGPRNNGDVFLLADDTVTADAATDALWGATGGTGFNWFWYVLAVDEINRAKAGETHSAI